MNVSFGEVSPCALAKFLFLWGGFLFLVVCRQGGSSFARLAFVFGFVCLANVLTPVC